MSTCVVGLDSHDACVFVGDGRKALFWRNAAMRNFSISRLNACSSTTIRQPMSKGSDRPGRIVMGAGTNRLQQR